MDSWLLALLIKPFVFLGFITMVAYLGWLAKRYLPEGKLRKVLLFRLYVADWERAGSRRERLG